MSNIFNYIIIAFDNSIVEEGFSSQYEAAKWMHEAFTYDFIKEMQLKIIRKENYYERS